MNIYFFFFLLQYYGVLYLEGIYNITVPIGCDCDVFSPLSVGELPKGVKKRRRTKYTYGRFKDFDKVYVDGEKFHVWFDGVHAYHDSYYYYVEIDGNLHIVPEELFYNIVSGDVGRPEVVMIVNLL